MRPLRRRLPRRVPLVVAWATIGCAVLGSGCGDDAEQTMDAGWDAQRPNDATTGDAVSPRVDSGAAPVDSGPARVDSGTDSGPARLDAGAGVCTSDFAPTSMSARRLLFVEPATGVMNVWLFTSDTTALLVGTGSFSYTYVRTDGCSSRITFSVGGSDVYVMTWTSATGGTCTESFDGSPPTPCTFNAS